MRCIVLVNGCGMSEGRAHGWTKSRPERANILDRVRYDDLFREFHWHWICFFFYPKYFYQIFLMLRTIFNPHRVVFWEISLYICVPPSDWLMCTVVCFCCWTWSKLNLIRVKLGEAQFATRSTHHGCWLSLLYKIEMAINLDCVAVVALPWNGFKFELKTSHNLCNQQLKSDHQFN